MIPAILFAYPAMWKRREDIKKGEIDKSNHLVTLE